MRHARRFRNAFTLLELLLTLSLAVVLMVMINAAFLFYARDMDANDVDMRQTMLAAAVIQMIEDDLRGALHPEPIDTTALEELLAKTASAASGLEAAGAPEGMTEGDLDAAGMSDSSGTENEETEEDTSLETTTNVLEAPGLIGNQYQIQIDTSRLPRLEEYNLLLQVDPTKLNDIPSDLKTVTYYVQPEGAIGINDPLTEFDSAVEPKTGGLVRRELDRAATTFASLAGNISTLNQTGQLIAPEVLEIEFSYWDGVMWQIEWNSDALQELPLAIKIQLKMAGIVTIDNENPEPRLFQHIVRLPLAKFIEEEEDMSMEEAGI